MYAYLQPLRLLRTWQAPRSEPAAGSGFQGDTVALMGPITPTAEFITDQKQQNYILVTVLGICSHSKTDNSNANIQLPTSRGTVIKEMTLQVNKNQQHNISLSIANSKPPLLRIMARVLVLNPQSDHKLLRATLRDPLKHP